METITNTIQAAWPLPTRTPFVSPLPTPLSPCSVSVVHYQQAPVAAILLLLLLIAVIVTIKLKTPSKN